MNKWLFLRGEWDERTQKSIDDNDDVWQQLAMELAKDKDSHLDIVFKCDFETAVYPGEADWEKTNIDYPGNLGSKPCIFAFNDISSRLSIGMPGKYDYVFARGGFDYYLPMLKDNPEAYKIRYGAGARFIPEPEINYQLILVDTEAQKQAVLDKYPGANVNLLIKPAASHFKPIECEKEYDVCYIANYQQARFKGVKWVYETVPRDLRVLHLGYIDEHITPPPNVIRKRVDRIDMPKWISKCKVGIVPYDNVDSAPRALVEMVACGLNVVCLDSVNYWRGEYPCFDSDKADFWNIVDKLVIPKHSRIINSCVDPTESIYKSVADDISKFYQENLSIPVAAKHIKDLINGNNNQLRQGVI